MAEKDYKVNFGTSIDTTNLEKGLTAAITKAENEVIKAAQKQTEAVQKAAHDQIEVIRKKEEKEIAIVKNGIQEKIAAIKAMPDLSGAEKQKEIKKIKENADAEIRIIKDKAKLSETAVKSMADKQIKTYNDLAKKQIKAIQDANKKSLTFIKEFAKGAASELLGIDQVLSTIAGGPTAWGKAFIDAGKQIISTLNQWSVAATESIKIQDTLKAVLKSTGASAWASTGALNQMARDQSEATGRSRDEITQMQSVLLGFKSVTKDVFGDATKAVLDMSQVMGGDLKGAANMLGKALEAPTQGMAALSRSGFTWTEQEKEQIKQLEKSGNLLEAQKIILGQVKEAFNDAATAVNPAVKAQVAYNNAINNFKIQMGTAWAQVTAGWKQAIADFIQDTANAIENANELREALKKLKDGTADNTDALTVQEEKLRLFNKQLVELNRLLTMSAAARRDYGYDSKAQVEAAIQRTTQQINQLKNEVEWLKKRNEIEESIISLTDRAAKAALEADTAAARLFASQAKAAREQAVRFLDMGVGFENQARSYQQMAEAAAKAAEAEADRVKTINENNANIAKWRKEYEESLKQQTAEIYKRAELEGKAKDSLEVQDTLLKARMSVYENLLKASNGLLTGELSYEKAIEQTIIKERERLELVKFSDEERKKRLAELSKLQGEALSNTTKIYEQAVNEADKLFDTQKEQNFQDELTEVRRKSFKKAVNFESEYRQAQRDIEYQNQLTDLADQEITQRERLKLLKQAELEAAGGNAAEKLKIEEKYTKDLLELEGALNNARVQLGLNLQMQRKQAELETVKAVEQANIEMWQKLLSEAQKYHNAVQDIANSISAIWTNNIEYETNEKLRANKAMVQSDEERAAAEKKILIESAYEKYKAELFAWAANVTSATAQAAMAVLNALNSQPFLPMGPIMAGIATATGALQVASVISARPKPPVFHTGGVVQGRPGQEVNAVLKTGEVVSTQKQFQDFNSAIASLASMKAAPAGLNVQVINNAANTVTTSQRIDTDGLKIVIKHIVNQGLGDGSFDSGLNSQRQGLQGAAVTN
jgi:hypothetical protein